MLVTPQAVGAFALITGCTADVVCHAWFARLPFSTGSMPIRQTTSFHPSPHPVRRARMIPWRQHVRFLLPSNLVLTPSLAQHCLLLLKSIVNIIGVLLSKD